MYFINFVYKFLLSLVKIFFLSSRLARIKTEARRRREERDRIERLKQLEQERREKAFMEKFSEWNVQHDGRVELSLVIY